MLRGVRGATTVDSNSETEILQATEELLLSIQEKYQNKLKHYGHTLRMGSGLKSHWA